MSKISWNENQQKRLRNAVRRYNRQVDKMKQSGIYDFVPERTTYAKEKERIYTRQQLYTRLAQIDRIKKTGAAAPVEHEGYIVPTYLRNEIRNAIRNINRGRQEFRATHLPTDLTDIEFATAISNSNFADIDTHSYYSGYDLEDLISSMLPNISNRVNMYVALFKDNMMGYDGAYEALEVLSLMADKYPDKLLEIFESNLEEVDISYIYPANPPSSIVPGVFRTFTVEGKVYNYKNGAANQTPEEDRIGNVINFWKYVGYKYFPNLGYGEGIDTDKFNRYEKDDILNNLTYKPRRKRSRR